MLKENNDQLSKNLEENMQIYLASGSQNVFSRTAITERLRTC